MKQSVKAISITMPLVDGVDTPEQLLAFKARVSNAANQFNHETGPKLIKRLIKHHEWSPLEMLDMTMEIVTTRDIGRQILRHRSFGFQEFSQRYSAVEDEWIERECRLQDAKNRQGSLQCDDAELNYEWLSGQVNVWQMSIDAYNWALQNGIAKEQARALLPEGLTPTRMYMKGSLRSWYHFTQLRMGPETQKEHREIAQMCFDILAEKFPTLFEKGE